MADRSSLYVWTPDTPTRERIVCHYGPPEYEFPLCDCLALPCDSWDEATSAEAEEILRTSGRAGIVGWGSHYTYDAGATVFDGHGSSQSVVLTVDGSPVVEFDMSTGQPSPKDVARARHFACILHGLRITNRAQYREYERDRWAESLAAACARTLPPGEKP